MERSDELTRIDDPRLPARSRRRALVWGGLVLVSAAAGAATRLAVHHDATAVFGDVDGDGRSDLVLRSTQEVRAYRSTAGAFQETDLGVPGAAEVVRGDVDGDGRADLVEVEPGDSGSRVVVHRAEGGRYRTAGSADLDGVTLGQRCVLADVDGDGDDDLVAVGSTGIRVALARDGRFAAPRRWAEGVDLGKDAFVLAGRFDGDHREDLLLLDTADGGASFTVLRSTGRRFDTGRDWRTVPGWTVEGMRPVAGDVDGDGRADVLELGQPAAGGTDVMVLRSRGTDFGPPQQWARDDSGDWRHTRALAGDFDGDGRTDLATLTTASDDTTTVSVLLSRGTRFSDPVPWLTGQWPGVVRPVGRGSGVLGAESLSPS